MTSLPHNYCLSYASDPEVLGTPIPSLLDRRLLLLEAEVVPALLDSFLRMMDATDGEGRVLKLMGAVFKRTESLLSGFAALARARNGQAGMLLVRAQLDTVMRLHALWLVDDQDTYFKALLAGKARNFITWDGKDLTDDLLHKRVSQCYPGLSADYGDLSGIVHLSTFALVAPAEWNAAGDYGMRLDHADWANQGICSAVTAFALYSAAIVHMFDILSLSASGGVLNDVLEPGREAFDVVPLRPWLNSFMCAAAAVGR